MKAIFVPSVMEARKIFPVGNFIEWKYGIFKGEFKGIPVFTTGVSKTPTAFSLPVIINEFKISEAILTGVCGAYRSSKLSVGDLITINKDHFVDEGLYHKGEFQSIVQMGFGFSDTSYSEFEIFKDLPVADSNTVSFLDGEGKISEIFQKSTGADVENMEGAAFGYACKMLGIKCFQVRAVSNYCGARDEQGWDFKKAILNLKRFFDFNAL
ncbi:MAG: hypothetical protein C0603_12395 [Denitrovibrio sp.]|nr:MAG: hypothetical protein C0603_12395 [Denitrovibrio sp.]